MNISAHAGNGNLMADVTETEESKGVEKMKNFKGFNGPQKYNGPRPRRLKKCSVSLYGNRTWHGVQTLHRDIWELVSYTSLIFYN